MTAFPTQAPCARRRRLMFRAAIAAFALEGASLLVLTAYVLCALSK